MRLLASSSPADQSRGLYGLRDLDDKEIMQAREYIVLYLKSTDLEVLRAALCVCMRDEFALLESAVTRESVRDAVRRFNAQSKSQQFVIREEDGRPKLYLNME
ncbi:MAG: hypothetical protein NTW87_00380 [Planctomycetota bacterium]|nr:hypothetical protein [Planctomycetota bacterium]